MQLAYQTSEFCVSDHVAGEHGLGIAIWIRNTLLIFAIVSQYFWLCCLTTVL